MLTTVIFSVWGSPWRDPCRFEDSDVKYTWGKVRYVLRDVEDSLAAPIGDSSIEPKRTPLSILEKRFSPKRIVLLVCDSVVCTDDLSGEDQESSFTEIVKIVRKKYKRFLQEEAQSFKDRVKIEVIPCRGNFVNGLFECEPTDTYTFILYVFLRNIARVHKPGDNLRVVLDLSHGINYLPVYLYRAAKAILPYIAFTSNVSLLIYNSDPFHSGVVKEEMNEVGLNLIERLEVKPFISLRQSFEVTSAGAGLTLSLSFRSYNPPATHSQGRKNKGRLSDLLKFELKDRANIQEKLQKLALTYAAVYIGAPLAVTYFYPPLQDIWEVLYNYFDHYSTKLRRYLINKSKVLGISVGAMKPNILFILEALALGYALTPLMDECGETLSKNKWVTYKELVRIKEVISWNEVIEAILTRGLNDIEMDFCCYAEGKDLKRDAKLEECIPKIEQQREDPIRKGMALRELRLMCKDNIRISEIPDRRNFIAHAGFEYNVTKIRLEGGNLKLTYDSNSIEKVKEFLKQCIIPHKT